MGKRAFDMSGGDEGELIAHLADLLANGFSVRVLGAYPLCDFVRIEIEGSEVPESGRGAPWFSVTTDAAGKRSHFIHWRSGQEPTPFKLWSDADARRLTPSLTESAPALSEEPIAQFFAYEHLPPHLQEVSRPFGELAQTILTLPRNPERTVALRKLLEAKDAAVRARLFK